MLLSEILSGGLLTDNRSYRMTGDRFANGMAGASAPAWEVDKKNKPNAFEFLRDIALKTAGTAGKVTVVMPDQDGYEHNTRDDFLTLAGNSRDAFSLGTGNLVGRVGDRKHKMSVQVTSRFGDDFLKYIIAAADGFADMPHGGGDSKGKLDWLLVYYWVVKLKKAYRRGLPKLYATRNETLANVRGRIDPLDYALNAERGRFACQYREHSFDNEVTRLIARTLQVLDSHSFLRDCHALNQSFQAATHGVRYRLDELLDVQPLRNPYFQDYNSVIRLAKQILRNEFADFGDDDDSSSLLFDMSMLFEYFVKSLLVQDGFLVHGKDAFHLRIPNGLAGGKRKLLPDLVFEHEDRTWLFDVKYKSFDFTYGANAEDLFQLNTYAASLSAQRPLAGCGLIYPIRESRWQKPGIISEPLLHGGGAIPFHIAFIPVPESGPGFAERFGQRTRDFMRDFRHRLAADAAH